MRENRKRLILMVLPMMVYMGNAPAQGITQPSNPLLPSIVQPSPTAASLGRFGQWPVSYYTGVPNIGVPLYEVRSGNLSLPISLGYHASGIKVEDVSSWVGTGWALDAGGVITRSVVGLPDETSNGFFFNQLNHINKLNATYDLNTYPDNQYFSNVALGGIDAEPDMYYFNFAGHSGKFFFDTSGTFHAIPENTLMVTKNPLYNTDGSGHWEIVDDMGTTYVFGPGDDNFITNNGVESSVLRPPSAADYQGGPAITAWYLTAVISKEKTDTIHLTYANKSETYQNTTNSAYKICTNPQDVSGWEAVNAQPPQGGSPAVSFLQGPGLKTVLVSYSGNYVFGNSLLSAISWRGGSVQFTAGLNRQDLVYAGLASGTMLTNMQVSSTDGRFNTGYSFIYEYTNGRYYLDTLRQTDNTGGKVYDYSFNYNPGLPSRSSFARDHWGYYNGVDGNTDLLPALPDFSCGTQYCPLVFNAHSNRAVNPAYAQCGTLSQVHFPTGGMTQFAYESNQCLQSSIPNLDSGVVVSATAIGGLRVKAIYNYTDNGCTLSSTRHFTYLPGYLLGIPSYTHYLEQNISNEQTCQSPPCSATCYFFARLLETTSNSQSILGFTQGSVVGYTDVTEQSTDLNSNNNGYTTYNYSYSPDVLNQYVYSAQYWQDPNINSSYYHTPADVYDYKRGLLLGQKTYSNGNTLLKSVSNTYNFNDGNTANRFRQVAAIRIKQLRFGAQPGQIYQCAPWQSNNLKNPLDDDYNHDYGYSFYNAVTSWVQRMSTTSVSYDQNGQNPVTTTTNYSYGNVKNLQPTQATVLDSKGNTEKVAFTYPSDSVSSNGTPNVYDSMVGRNMISTALSQTKTLNGTFMESQNTSYAFTGPTGNLIEPSSISAQILANPAELRAQFHAYDKYGNVLERSKANGAHEVYLYGYNSLYPVAKILGGTYAAASQYVSQPTLDNPANDQQVASQMATLRSSLPGSLVTSRTFAPLMGVTSETDPSGKTNASYRYDGIGRLVDISDIDGNILKKYNYAYAPGTTACSTTNVYYNEPQSQSFTCNTTCGAGYTPGQVTYTVAGGTYSSSLSVAQADSLAENDILANGQAYADAHPVCVLASQPSVSISCNNIVGVAGYTEVFTNTLTNIQYSFAVPAAGGVLGNIPQGTYNLTFSPSPSVLGRSLYGVGCTPPLSSSGTSTVTFSYVGITQSTCNTTTIDTP